MDPNHASMCPVYIINVCMCVCCVSCLDECAHESLGLSEELGLDEAGVQRRRQHAISLHTAQQHHTHRRERGVSWGWVHGAVSRHMGHKIM
jgi:formate hydrogenlyase subunit 6/NADH:ubiquinone oxidoreductase subunit I